jgi:hypothetical protein
VGLAEGRTVAESENDWSPDERTLFNWFQANRARLPRKRFTLSPGVVVSDMDRFLETLQRDIEAGPNGARGRHGAVRDDLRKLREIFGDAVPSPGVQKRLPVGMEAASR